jgi:threonine dehydrogenase-like Zn-dependent dehydrogenase
VVAASESAEVVAVDPVPERRALAQSLGASVTIDPTSSDTRSAVLELTRGRGAEASVDTSGNPRALSEALGVLRPKGKMVVLAATGPWTLDPGAVRQGGHTLIGSWVYALGEYASVARLAERRAQLLKKVVTRRFRGDEGPEAFRTANLATEGKVVIDWTR